MRAFQEALRALAPIDDDTRPNPGAAYDWLLGKENTGSLWWIILVNAGDKQASAFEEIIKDLFAELRR